MHEDVVAELPVPTAGDAGKGPVVNETETGYVLGAAPGTVVASGTTNSDPGSAVTVAFAGDHTALSDADFLHLVQRSYRVIQLSNPDPSGFAATPFLVSAADASAGTIDVRCIAVSIPFEVV